MPKSRIKHQHTGSDTDYLELGWQGGTVQVFVQDGEIKVIGDMIMEIEAGINAVRIKPHQSHVTTQS